MPAQNLQINIRNTVLKLKVPFFYSFGFYLLQIVIESPHHQSDHFQLQPSKYHFSHEHEYLTYSLRRRKTLPAPLIYFQNAQIQFSSTSSLYMNESTNASLNLLPKRPKNSPQFLYMNEWYFQMSKIQLSPNISLYMNERSKYRYYWAKGTGIWE